DGLRGGRSDAVAGKSAGAKEAPADGSSSGGVRAGPPGASHRALALEASPEVAKIQILPQESAAQQRDRQTAQDALFSGGHRDDPCSNELSEKGPCLSLRNLTSHEFVDEARLAHPTVVVSEPCDEGEGALPEIRLVGMQHLVVKKNDEPPQIRHARAECPSA